MRYTLEQFIADYPNEDKCLEYLFLNRAQKTCSTCGSSKYYRVTKRKAFVCKNGHYFHPLKGTIFEKSRTSLRRWFFVIYLFSVSKNGVAATEIQRHLGVTYKTAWRMGHQVRKLMKQDDDLVLFGTVEVDELYIGGRRRIKKKYSNKIPVYGFLQRNGKLKAYVMDGVNKSVAKKMLHEQLMYGSTLYADDSSIYHGSNKYYKHGVTVHSKFEFVRGDTHTNSIEGFWGQLKRALHGTHHSVSKKWLQAYVNEFVFRYNYRSVPIFYELLSRC